MKILFPLFFFFAISLPSANCTFPHKNSYFFFLASIMEGYKLGSWKEENLTKIQFSIQKQTETQFSISIIIPLLWKDTQIGISIYLVDKQKNKIDSVNFRQSNRNDKQEYIANLSLAEFQKLNCVQQYLDEEQTIVRAQCQTFIEFNDKTQAATVSKDAKTIYMLLKYLFSVQYSTISSSIFNGIPLEKQQDCPCCETDCIKDTSLPEISQTINKDKLSNFEETDKALKFDTVTDDQMISFEFNLKEEKLILSKVYVENDNYQADITDQVSIVKNGGKIVMTSNLVAPVEAIGKYFGFRFIFTNNEIDENGKLKVKILSSKTIVIKNIKVSYDDFVIKNGKNEKVQNNTLFIVIVIGIFIAIISIAVFLQMNRNQRKIEELKLLNSSQDKKTPPYYQLPLEEQEKNQQKQKNQKEFELQQQSELKEQ